MSQIETIMDNMITWSVNAGWNILGAIVIYVVGRYLIKLVMRLTRNVLENRKVEASVKTFLLSFVNIALTILLIIAIAARLGIETTSFAALLASAGVAIGMAMQGALGNIAGGIMLLIFRPFNVGDYIVAGGEEGTVKNISLVYTVLTSIDNRRISIPNGTLMNSTVCNATAEQIRRVDLNFDIAGSEDADKVEKILFDVIDKTEWLLGQPAPQVLITAGVPGGLTYTVRVWVKTSDYWNEFGALMKEIPAALNKAGIARPSTPISVSK